MSGAPCTASSAGPARWFFFQVTVTDGVWAFPRVAWVICGWLALLLGVFAIAGSQVRLQVVAWWLPGLGCCVPGRLWAAGLLRGRLWMGWHVLPTCGRAEQGLQVPEDLRFPAHTLQADSGLAGVEGLERGTLRGQAFR